MIWAAILVAGFLVGLVVGRWWSLVVAVVLAGWIWAEWDDIEVPSWLLALVYGCAAALAIAFGVWVRTRTRRHPER